VGAEAAELDGGELAAAALGVIVAAALWWTYFDRIAPLAERSLESVPAGRARNVLARDSFSYLHLVMVAGIVLFALGVKKTLGDVDHELKIVPAIGVAGGVALYLAAQTAFEARNARGLDGPRLLTAAACAVVIPLATALPALAGLAIVAALCSALVTYETAVAGPV
jgi:low temperature requirement protein LtrA